MLGVLSILWRLLFFNCKEEFWESYNTENAKGGADWSKGKQTNFGLTARVESKLQVERNKILYQIEEARQKMNEDAGKIWCGKENQEEHKPQITLIN